MKTELNNSTQTNKPSNPTPTLTLPLKGREIAMFLPLQGGGQEGDGVFVGVVLNLPYRKINGTHKISAKAGIQENTGFPRIEYGAGLVRPGMTNPARLVSSCISLIVL